MIRICHTFCYKATIIRWSWKYQSSLQIAKYCHILKSHNTSEICSLCQRRLCYCLETLTSAMCNLTSLDLQRQCANSSNFHTVDSTLLSASSVHWLVFLLVHCGSVLKIQLSCTKRWDFTCQLSFSQRVSRFGFYVSKLCLVHFVSLRWDLCFKIMSI